MTAKTNYQNLYTYRKCSVLTPDAQTAVFKLGQAIENGTNISKKIFKFRDALKTLPASSVPRASIEIREIAKFHKIYHQPVQTSGFLIKLVKPTLLDKLNSNPDLGWLLIFHGNGYVRQAALEKLNNAPESEFEFSAIVYRLNDWVGNVRTAATQYAASFFPKTSSNIVGQSSFFLLAQAQVLNRWNQDEQTLLEDTIYRPDVLKHIKDQFLSIRSGRVGHTFQQILRRSDFDTKLNELAHEAILPSVRAVAMDALLNNRARWFVGYKKQWVDKVFGISRRSAEFGTRPIDVQSDFETLLLNAASDKSAQVRKIAISAMITRIKNASKTMDEVARKLQTDKNLSVRSRVDFYLRTRKTQRVI